MKSVSHITPSHLLERLLAIGFFERFNGKHHHPRKIGICVSGGPDSMALAYLLQNMPHPHNSAMKAFLPRAFVVDHCARDGSYEEAVWVKNQLEALNIETDVRRITWPHSVDPKSMPGFELRAREKRYATILGLARMHRLMHLFTGHHEDDLVETLLLRLLRDRTLNLFSFRVMGTPSPVPGSETYPWASSVSSLIGQAPSALPGSHSSPDQLRYEHFSTGAQLHRPLLKYRKSHLVATCEHFRVPYIQDKTNFDPRLTPRNAIRHLRTNHNLPRALQSEAILNLLVTADSVIDAIEEQARKFCDYISEFRMHNESGFIQLRLKRLPRRMSDGQLRGFSSFVARLIALVTPQSRSDRPAMLERDYTEHLLGLTSGSEKMSYLVSQKVVCSRVSDLGGCRLSFSRQPLTLLEKDSMTKHCAPHDVHGSEPVDTRLLNHAYHCCWDRRFWIKITGKKDVLCNTVMRAYEQSDVSAVIKALKHRTLRKAFNEMLSTIAPAEVRFTLPVLVVSGEVVAFPTLDFAVISNPPISWTVKFARDIRSTEFFFPGVNHDAKILWDFTQSASDTDQEVPSPDGDSRKMYPLYNRSRYNESSETTDDSTSLLPFLQNRPGGEYIWAR